MAKELTYVLNIDVNKSMNSLFGIRQEMRKVQRAMEEAAEAGNSKAYEELTKRFIELREESEILNSKLQPLDKQMQLMTRGIGNLINVGQNLALVLGADSKSAEELFKTFAKVQAISNLINGFNEIAEMMPKLKYAFLSLGDTIKSAFASNPVGAIITAILALGSALAVVISQMDNLSDEAKRQQFIAEKTAQAYLNAADSYLKTKVELERLLEVLNKSTVGTEEYIKAVKDLSEELGLNSDVLLKNSDAQKILNELVKERIELIKLESEAEAMKSIYIEARKEQLSLLYEKSKAEQAAQTTFWQDFTTLITSFGNAVEIYNKTITNSIQNYTTALKDAKNKSDDIQKAWFSMVEKTEEQKKKYDKLVESLGLLKEGAKQTTNILKDFKAELNLTIFSQTTFDRAIQSNKETIEQLNEQLKHGILSIEEYRKRYLEALNVITASQKLQTIYSSEWGKAWNDALEKAVGKNPKEKAELVVKSWDELEKAEKEALEQLRLYNIELAKGDKAAFLYWNTLTKQQQMLIKLGQRLVEVENNRKKSIKESEDIIFNVTNKEIKVKEDKLDILFDEWSLLISNYNMNEKLIKQSEKGGEVNRKLAEERLSFLEKQYEILEKLYKYDLNLTDEEISKLNILKNEIKTLKKELEKGTPGFIELLIPKGVEFEEEWTTLANQLYEKAINLAERISNAFYAIKKNRLEQELQDQKEYYSKLEQQEIDAINNSTRSEEEKRKRIAEIQGKYDAIQKEQEKEAAEKKKRWAISEAVIQGALAVLNVWATRTLLLDPMATISKVAQSAFIAATTAAQIAVINSQKFAKGGLLRGPSHQNGGIVTPFGELEGGEAVINKSATKMFAPVLSTINQSTGGNPIGPAMPLIDYDLLASKINEKKVYVLSHEITKQQQIDIKVENRATI